jgi:phospholipase C
MIWKNIRWMLALALASNLAVLAPGTLLAGQPGNGSQSSMNSHTTTPIKHVVVIFQENVSFDHYFATYPLAANPAGEPHFKARSGFLFPTPSVNGLSGNLLTNNPNSTNPFRLDRSQASTCDQNHNYGAEQSAFDQGLMDNFPATIGVSLLRCQLFLRPPERHIGYGLLRRQHGHSPLELRPAIRHE